MSSNVATTELNALRRCWCHWTATVELYARARRGRARVRPSVYRRLHGELTQTCRALADASEGPRREFFEGLLTLAEPWLSPNVLVRADRAILANLLSRCREVERELGGRSGLSAVVGSRPALLVWFSAALASLAASRLTARDWMSGLERVRGWSDVAWAAIVHFDDYQKLLVFTLVVVGVSIHLASRAAHG
jgi:hypothetical protein